MATNNAINKKSASITFDGTNILSNYVVETAWTPDVQFGGAKVGVTYGTQYGYYYRIGNVLFFYAFIDLSSKGSSTGNVSIEGLPTATTHNMRGTMVGGGLTYTGEGLSYLASGSSLLLGFGSNAGAAMTALDDTHCANNSVFRLSGFYFV